MQKAEHDARFCLDTGLREVEGLKFAQVWAPRRLYKNSNDAGDI